MLESFSSGALVFWLLALFLICGFLSAAETSVMSLNRYRLKHLAKTDKQARRLIKLLSHPEHLIGALLIGNTFAVTYIGAIGTQMGQAYLGDWSELAPAILGSLLLIFCEIIPKTIAAMHPERVAYPIAWTLQSLLWLFYPVVLSTSFIAKKVLTLCRVRLQKHPEEALTSEELRTLVHETKGMMNTHYQTMLLGILDLEKTPVDFIMVPKSEVVGLDLKSAQPLYEQLQATVHTLLPVYEGNLNNVLGVIHKKDLISLRKVHHLSAEQLLQMMREPYFVLESTTLYQQLLQFQEQKCRLGLVIDEYGDIQGLITLEDILQEIVGEFTTGKPSAAPISLQADGSYLVAGSIPIRELNRSQLWDFPNLGAHTLNGLIIEYLEAIPEPHVCLSLNQCRMEILEVKDNTVQTVRLWPRAPLKKI